MNGEPQLTIEAADTFESRIDVILHELELAIKWQRPILLLAVYGSSAVHVDAAMTLEDYLLKQGHQVVWLRFDTEESIDLLSTLTTPDDVEQSVLFIDLKQYTDDADKLNVFLTLNLHREQFLEKRAKIVFWLSEKEIIQMAYYAPDIWSFRHRVVDFCDGSTPEHMYKIDFNSDWREPEDSEETFEDLDAKISLRESFLDELPEGDEAVSVYAHLMLTLGILYWRKKDYGKASELLHSALEIGAPMKDNWFDAQCYNAIALVMTGMGKIREAIRAYKKAIHHAPGQVSPWNNLGNLYSKLGHIDESIDAYLEAIKHNPDDAVSWNGLGNAYLKTLSLNEAIDAYQKAIECAPNFANPWNGLGDVYFKQGRYDDAISALLKAIDLKSNFVEPWINLGNIYMEQERNADAISAYQKAAEFAPTNVQIWINLGSLYSKRGLYADAICAYEKATQMDNGSGWLFSSLASAYFHNQQYSQAIPIYKKSINLFDNRQDQALVWNKLGDTYRHLQDYSNAVVAYRTADELVSIGSDAGKNKMDDFDEQYTENWNIGGPPMAEENANPIEIDQVSTSLYEEPSPQPKAPLRKIELPVPAREEIPTQSQQDTLFDQELQDSNETLPAVQEDDRTGHLDPADDELNRAEDLATIISPNTDEQDDQQSTIFNGGETMETKEIVEIEEASVHSEADAAETDKAAAVEPGVESEAKLSDTIDEDTDKSAYEWSELGNLYLDSGSYENAVKAYLKAIVLAPEFGWGYSNLALAYYRLGRYEEAVSLYQRSIELLRSQEERAISWSRLGDAYRGLGEYDNAMDAYCKSDGLADGRVTEIDEPTAPGNTPSDDKIVLEEEAEDKAQEPVTTSDQRVEVGGAETPVLEDGEAEMPAEEPDADAVQAEVPLAEEQTVVETPDATHEPAAEESTAEAAGEVTSDNEAQLLESGWLRPDENGVEERGDADINEEKVVDQPIVELTSGIERESAQLGLPLKNEVPNDVQDTPSSEDTPIVLDEDEEKTASDWYEEGNRFLEEGSYDDAIIAYQKAIDLTSGYAWPYINNLALAYYQKGKYAEFVSLYRQNLDSAATVNDTVEQEGVDQASEANPAVKVEDANAGTDEQLADTDEATNDVEENPGNLPQSEGDTKPVGEVEEVVPSETASSKEDLTEDLTGDDVTAGVEGEELTVEDNGQSDVADEADEAVVAVEVYVAPENEEQIPAGDIQVSDESEEHSEKSAFEWNEMGNLYLKAGSYENAIAAYKNAIELAPEFGWAYSNLALAYYRQGRYEDAVSLYQKSIELLRSKEEKAVSWNRLGNAYRRIEDHHSAIEAYRTADQLSMDVSSLLSRARLVLLNNE